MCQTTNFNFTQRVNAYMHNNTQNSRAQAYDICHKEFEKAIASNNFDDEYLALHLYSFLATWGMVCRGNYLLKNNYKVLIPVVKVVCDAKYRNLLNIDILDMNFNRNNYVTLMIELKNNLVHALVGYNAKNKDTMLSKIALATLGCVVGYDVSVKSRLKSLGYAKSFSKKGLIDLISFVNAYKNDILALKTKHANFNYSIMKICDCALF